MYKVRAWRGGQGVWVAADGEYASGMGAPPKPGFALAGVSHKKGGVMAAMDYLAAC